MCLPLNHWLLQSSLSVIYLFKNNNVKMLGLTRDFVAKALVSRTFHIRNSEDVSMFFVSISN